MKRMAQLPKATLIVLLLCTLMCLAVNFLPVGLNATEKAILLGAYYKPMIIAGEYWRLISCGLLHVSFYHLFVNMYSLMNLGTVSEKMFGVRRYLLILCVSVISGSLFLFALAGNTVAVGLSGGLYGLMAAVLFEIIRRGGWKNQGVRNSMTNMILINLLINFVPGIAWQAHIGGAFGGLMCAVVMKAENRSDRINALIGSVLLAGVLVFVCLQRAEIRRSETYAATDARVLLAEESLGLKGHAVHMAEKLDALYDIEYLEEILK